MTSIEFFLVVGLISIEVAFVWLLVAQCRLLKALDAIDERRAKVISNLIDRVKKLEKAEVERAKS